MRTIKADVLNPLELIDEIAERYRRYLSTTFYFRDPVLRASFRDALGATALVRRPYLDATPPFRQAKTPRRLFEELLGRPPEPGFLKAVRGDRPLYQHQEEAVVRAWRGHNIVVATGTGSGKTESFLFPILLHLYRQHLQGKLGPGVRALILYPMNALANDQRDRLGEISRRLADAGSSFRFTYGQYIGHTPEDENDKYRRAREQLAARLPGELATRSEMRKNPPHILLTNYSMLEYLLIRPQDSPLFDNGCARWWRYLVLDEAHQYRGARGMEMAMLLRRLKQRLREGGRTEPFCCLATSATLMGGADDRAPTADFAATLFGERYYAEDVITGTTKIPTADGAGIDMSIREYELLLECLADETAESLRTVRALAKRAGVISGAQDDPRRLAGRLLLADSRSRRLRDLVTGHARVVDDAAAELFPELPKTQRITALDTLVQLHMRAVDPGTEDAYLQWTTPLLSARYHFFLRAPDGAYLSYHPEQRIVLDRSQAEGPVFEVALCKECGQHYLVGKIRGNPRRGKFIEAVRDPSHPDFGTTFFRPLEGMSGTENKKGAKNQYHLCTRCKAIWRSGSRPACTHEGVLIVERQEAAKKAKDRILRCNTCGYRGQDPVREVVTGGDGPHAVIATTLHERLPESRRKVLAFADSRMEAAYFAWYLEKSYQDILHRNLILKAADCFDSCEGLGLDDIISGLYGVVREKGLAPPEWSSAETRRWVAYAILREFLSEETRLSLEGVGLGSWTAEWPDWYKIPDFLHEEPWALSKEDAWQFLTVMADSFRAQGAVELQFTGSVAVEWSGLGLLKSQTRIRIGDCRGMARRGVRSWDGPRGNRAIFLQKLLAYRGVAGDEAKRLAADALRQIWDAFLRYDKNAPRKSSRLLLPVADDCYRINSAWWRFKLVGDSNNVQ